MPKRDRIVIVLEHTRTTDMQTLEDMVAVVTEAFKSANLPSSIELVNLSCINLDAQDTERVDAPR